jgi:uncharacterized FAD-dependent dehydrogenase
LCFRAKYKQRSDGLAGAMNPAAAVGPGGRVKTVDVQLPIDADVPPSARDAALLEAAGHAAGLAPDEVVGVSLLRRSLDARGNRMPRWSLRVTVFGPGDVPPDGSLPPAIRPLRLARPVTGLRPIIVGMGPAGLFAALAFADAGVACTVLDRGAQVEARNLHVRDLRKKGVLQAESNLCFGEGGAGTYSDGKLYTRSRHPLKREVYERLVALGITREILDAHPHVGTNRLIPMARVLRDVLQEAGHTLRFDARVDDLILGDDDGQPVVRGVQLASGEAIVGGPVILATGHSARDTYRMLAERGVALDRKPFAIGARVEHPQSLIDDVQLGGAAGHRAVGAAEYFLKQQVASERGLCGVYSFCMCPGGFVLPSPTREGRLNVNGMSNEGRNSRFANAALVAQIDTDAFFLERPGDLDDHPEFGGHVAQGALVGLALQDTLERRCWQAGGGGYVAPAQRFDAFVAGEPSADLPARTSYRPGVQPADVATVLPSRVAQALRRGAVQADRRQLRGYVSGEAIIIPVETTTSSPVRILRDEAGVSVSHRGLYPVAEGAGYSGGIVSSAIEGLEAARRVLCSHGVPLPQTLLPRPASHGSLGGAWRRTGSRHGPG